MYGATTELPARVIDAIAEVAAAEVSRVAQAIPATPAAHLGRLAQPQPDRHSALRWQTQPRLGPAQPGSAAKAGLAELPQLVAERLLGALELTVAALDLPVPRLIEALPEAPAGPRKVAIASLGTDSEMSVELSKLDAFVPAATDMVSSVVAALAEHPSIAPLLLGTGSDETAIAADHGARHLALTVLVAAIVLRPLWPTITPPAVVGAALGVATPMLRNAPMPPAYAEAVLAKRRAEYLMPRHGSTRAVVIDHVFTLAEGPLTSAVDFSDNGLLAVLADGIAVRTRQESGTVPVTLRVVDEPPEPDLSSWDEIVEAGWHAPAGGAVFTGNDQITHTTPPWPGSYRVRVSARGRDDEQQQQEHYEFVVWHSPAADPVVLKHSDRLGHVLRGEPEPPVPVAPDEVYRWVETSSLSEAATITFVADKSSSEVLRAFGADETAAIPLSEFYDRHYENIDPWVCVLDVPGGAVAVEFNGWQGSTFPVLRAASSPDNLAASMYWNVDAMRQFSLARNGEVLTQFELGLEDTTSAEALELLADLDVRGRHRNAVGLLAAARFTGVSLSAEDLARIEAVDIGYPILPLLPELHPVIRHPDGSLGRLTNGLLGTDIVRLADWPDDELRTLAWWAAAFAVARSEPPEHPVERSAVTATLVGRALTPEAEVLARRSHLYGQNKHHWLWMTLHAATNPDPLAAAIDSLDTARFAVAGHAAELQDQARAWLR